MLTLYLSPGGSSMAPHIALHEVGAEFAAHTISFKQKEHRSPAFRAVNPVGKVPALLIDGRLLTEVAGILFYLARRYPEAGLLPPPDAERDAQAVSWMSFLASHVHPSRSKGDEAWTAAFALAQQLLGGRDWALGTYSIVDIHLFRLYWRYVYTVKPPVDRFPALTAHYDRMMARPAVQKTIAIESAIGYELP